MQHQPIIVAWLLDGVTGVEALSFIDDALMLTVGYSEGVEAGASLVDGASIGQIRLPVSPFSCRIIAPSPESPA